MGWEFLQCVLILLCRDSFFFSFFCEGHAACSLNPQPPFPSSYNDSESKLLLPVLWNTNPLLGRKKSRAKAGRLDQGRFLVPLQAFGALELMRQREETFQKQVAWIAVPPQWHKVPQSQRTSFRICRNFLFPLSVGVLQGAACSHFRIFPRTKSQKRCWNFM